MSYEASAEHWSVDYEDRIAGLFAMREAFQTEIDDSIKSGDLATATQASFGHAMTSFELGDRVEGHSFMFMAGVLAMSDVVLAIESVRPDPLTLDLPNDRAEFDLPPFISEEPPRIRNNVYDEDHKIVIRVEYDERERQSEIFLRSQIAKSVTAAEAAANANDILDPIEKNGVLLNALQDISFYISDHEARDGRSFALLKLAQQIAEHTEVNHDGESTELAYLAYKQLLAMGMYLEGRTLPAIVQSFKALKLIDRGLYSETITSNDSGRIEPMSLNVGASINEARAAIASKILYASTTKQALVMWRVVKDTVRADNRYGPYTKSRPLKYIQNRAWRDLRTQYRGGRMSEDILQLVQSLAPTEELEQA